MVIMAKRSIKEDLSTDNPANWFGDTPVSPEDKSGLVGNVFDSVAESYDIMNDAMSLGIHRLWKDRFVEMVAPKAGHKILDVAGGTGDISFRMSKATNQQAEITVSDINPNMLDVGRRRAIDKNLWKNLSWVTADAEQLPFADNSFDRYTIAFGLRNVTHIENALAEANRVLKPGGEFWCLEFSPVQQPLLKPLYDRYSAQIIPKLGEVLANDRKSYEYLVESIRRFPNKQKLKTMMLGTNFEDIGISPLSLGIAVIHTGKKRT